MVDSGNEVASLADGRARHPVMSFEVFGTLLVSAVAPPAAVFAEIGQAALEAGLISMAPATFGAAREWAEKRVNASTDNHGSLDDIYAELVFSLGLSEKQEAGLKSLELATEKSLLRPIPSSLALVDQARQQFGRVIYTSDTYLPEWFIKECLEEHGLWQDGDVLHVSHRHGGAKRTEKLFRTMMSVERTADRSVDHGNDRSADVRGPKLAGGRSVLLAEGNLNRFETALASYRTGTDNISARLAGASRLARLNSGATTVHDRALVKVSAGVIAPLLTCYVMWILQRARQLGLKRLYFVARDAEVLMVMTKRLAGRLGCDIDCRYLYASRVVWNRSIAAAESPEAWRSLIFQSSHQVSNRDLLRRTGIGKAEAEAIIAGDKDAGSWDSAVDRSVLERALDQLQSSDSLARLIAGNRAVLVDYLDQEGLLDNVPHGFVDVGWKGTQHEVLVALQRERAVVPARGLFLGLTDSGCRFGELRDAYYFDSRPRATGTEGDQPAAWRRGAPRTRSQITLLETFCAGSHGTLLDYEREGATIKPVLAPGRDKEVERWGLDVVRRTIIAFADNLIISNDWHNQQADLRQATINVMEEFRTSPSRDEAQAWGSYPWEHGQGSNLRTVDLAPRRSINNFLVRLFGRLKLTRKRPIYSEWAEGSSVRSSLLANMINSPVETIRALRMPTKRSLPHVK